MAQLLRIPNMRFTQNVQTMVLLAHNRQQTGLDRERRCAKHCSPPRLYARSYNTEFYNVFRCFSNDNFRIWFCRFFTAVINAGSSPITQRSNAART